MAIVFQCPGGVSDAGRPPRTRPARARSRRGATTFGRVRLAGRRVHGVARAVVRAERVVAARARADVDRRAVARVELAAVADHLDRGLARTRHRRLAVARGGGPGSIGSPVGATRAARSRVTWPQCGPTNRCTLPGIGRPFWATIWSSASGCQRFGSRISVPGLSRPAARSQAGSPGRRSAGARSSRRSARTRSRRRRCDCRAPPASRLRCSRSRSGSRATPSSRRARRTSPRSPAAQRVAVQQDPVGRVADRGLARGTDVVGLVLLVGRSSRRPRGRTRPTRPTSRPRCGTGCARAPWAPGRRAGSRRGAPRPTRARPSAPRAARVAAVDHVRVVAPAEGAAGQRGDRDDDGDQAAASPRRLQHESAIALDVRQPRLRAPGPAHDHAPDPRGSPEPEMAGADPRTRGSCRRHVPRDGA